MSKISPGHDVYFKINLKIKLHNHTMDVEMVQVHMLPFASQYLVRANKIYSNYSLESIYTRIQRILMWVEGEYKCTLIKREILKTKLTMNDC